MPRLRLAGHRHLLTGNEIAILAKNQNRAGYLFLAACISGERLNKRGYPHAEPARILARHNKSSKSVEAVSKQWYVIKG
jgi:hypothetical protein